MVDRPQPGRWLLVAVRAQPGAAFTGGAVVGGENRRTKWGPPGRRLHDDEPDRRNTGDYQGVYRPTENGRHRAVVTIAGSPTASIADPVGRLNHSETGTIDTDPGAPFFVRQIVVSFDVGDRGKPEEPEQEKPSRPEPRDPGRSGWCRPGGGACSRPERGEITCCG